MAYRSCGHGVKDLEVLDIDRRWWFGTNAAETSAFCGSSCRRTHDAQRLITARRDTHMVVTSVEIGERVLQQILCYVVLAARQSSNLHHRPMLIVERVNESAL